MANRPVARHHHTHVRSLPLGAPPRAWALTEWAVLPLRLFLGATFLFAGLQKFANPDFFNASSPVSIQAQLIASARVSPVGSLVAHFEQVSVLVGVLIALGEVAIGLGTLVGLWGRVAAAGGVVLSLSLFLTVSFHSAPFYTGADIVFVFAWIPLLIAGSGSRFSMDGALARRAALASAAPVPDLVPIPFAEVQRLCGNFQKGSCRALSGAQCAPGVCPVLEGSRPSLITRASVDEVDRRAVVLGATRAVIVGAAGAAAVAVAAGVGRAGSHSSRRGVVAASTTTTTPGQTTTSSPLGTSIGASSQVAIGSAATFSVPSSGDPAVVVCLSKGNFVAYDTICPHAGCTVGYSAGANTLVCPCHGSQFDVTSGNVVTGPAPTGLTPLHVAEGPDGNLYIS